MHYVYSQEVAKVRRKKYKELTQRIDREKELNIIAQKMQGKRNMHVSINFTPTSVHYLTGPTCKCVPSGDSWVLKST